MSIIHVVITIYYYPMYDFGCTLGACLVVFFVYLWEGYGIRVFLRTVLIVIISNSIFLFSFLLG